MTNREALVLKSYNAILAYCLIEYRACVEIGKTVYAGTNTVRHKCEFLYQHGLLEKIRQKGRGKYCNGDVSFYKSVVSEYPIDDYMRVISTREVKRAEKKEENFEPIVEKSLAQPRYIHKMEDHTQKYRAQAAAMRKDYSHKNVGVSGGTLNSVFLA